ncbi:MAG TPA: pyridoxamine 5'-phosphate oxidase family protein [Dehalococcoidia bacterium]|jgi:predicted pyridoxine 5'-phosphate oxidase superfamily flavin-nucleotide-binding protein|nr:pyridoxamine 5'-phosphate oxidase family protein [Dehalococcoidia bacterium]
MSEMYHDGHRDLHQRFDTTRLADFFEDLAEDSINDDRCQFIEARDMFFLSTVDPNGRPNCSYKGGAPGFVRVIDEHTIAFPSYDGNGMYLSMGNIAETAEVGLLFIDFEEQQRLRLNGTATIDLDDELLAEYPEAQFIVRVRAREVFANCPRYIHKLQLVERSIFAPTAEQETPVAAWKAGMVERGAADNLPHDDRAHDTTREARGR